MQVGGGGEEKSWCGNGYTIYGDGMMPRLLTLILSCCVLLSGCATSSSPSGGTLNPVSHSIPPTPPGVYDIGQVHTPPRAILQGPPRYPMELRQAGIDGEATVYFIVNREGQVVNAFAVRADDERFGEAAREAVSLWQFQPARVDGQPVNCAMMVPITFTTEK